MIDALVFLEQISPSRPSFYACDGKVVFFATVEAILLMCFN